MEFFRKSVATKVGLVIGLMVLFTTMVMGGLFYFTIYENFGQEKYEEVIKRSEQVEMSWLENAKMWQGMANYLVKSDGQSNQIIERFLKTIPEVMAWQKFTRKGNTLHLFPAKQPIKGLYSEVRPNVLFELDKSFKVRGPESVGKDGFTKNAFVLEINTEKFKHFVLFENRGLSPHVLVELKDKDVFFVFNEKGHILAHRNSEKIGSFRTGITYTIFEELPRLNFKEFKSNSGKQYSLFTKYRGEGYTFSVVPIKLSEKVLLFGAAGSSISRRVNFVDFLSLKNSIVGLLLILAFTYLGWIFTRYLFRNLDEITEQAKKFTNGEHDIDIQVRSSDEIGILALTFQGMIRQVNERTRVLRKSERRIREARDQAEQALSSKSHLLEDLRRQKSEVERVSKDKDDLLAIVSHDLKNPLAVVETSMDIILEEEKNRMSPMASDLVRRSKNSARIALNLITDLLDLSRLEGGIRLDFERFSVDEMIDSVVDSFYLKSREKRINIEVIRERPYDIIADYGRLIQVLSNIIGNSLKFTPIDGHIKITIDEYATSHAYEGSNKGLLVTIEDNGPGIPEDKLDSIFNKFEQARKKDREIGTGLGLAICKNISELHNGEISADSGPGRGATFVIKIPRLLDHDETKFTGPKASQLVLVVNDDRDFRNEARVEFTKSGLQVVEAKNGEEMLQVLGHYMPDVIILDDEMPVMNGMEALLELEEKGLSHLPVAYLVKEQTPEKIEFLKNKVADIINEETSMSELVMRVSSIISPDSMTSLDKKLDEQKKTILVVDDEEGIRSILHENFNFLGYNCIMAKNGVEGLFLFQKYNIDLVVSDIRMSEVDGLTLTKSIHKEFPDTPVILMSANVDTISQSLSERLGIKKLFPKPFDVDELNDYVKALIGECYLLEKREILRDKKKASTGEATKKIEGGAQEEPRVLLVDDSEDMQTLFRVLLRKEDLKLNIAQNGKEAVDLFKKEDFQVIFMDMNMPVMGGEEAARHMREHEKGNGKRTHLVLLTADQFDDLEEVTNLGFDSYIKKPLNKKKILKEISNAKQG